MIANNQNSQYHYLFKIVLVGNTCVGKSSIVIRYADNQFSDVFLATIGVDFRFKSFPLNGNKIKLQIWDTAGSQRFRTITGSYYRGVHALLIVFDITDHSSFVDATGYWHKQIRDSCPPTTQILLIGNKCDLSDKRAVSQQQIQRALAEHPQIQYIQTSAKTAERIEEAFVKIAQMLLEEQNKKNAKKQKKKQRDNTKLSKTQCTATKKICCNA